MFRSNTPKRSNVSVNHYSDAFEELRKDFNQRCGYCDISDEFYTVNFFQIDHFRPSKKFDKYEHEYFNLVYSCRNCNGFKSDYWATQDENSPINDENSEGLVDPCSEAYSELFSRNERGSIMSNDTLISQFIYRRLKFYLFKRTFSYQIDQMRSKIESIVRHKNKSLLTTEELILLNEIQLDIPKYINFVEMNYKNKN